MEEIMERIFNNADTHAHRNHLQEAYNLMRKVENDCETGIK
jgi:hypothetical protein